MMDRQKILKEFSPKLSKVDFESPLQIGNGNLAFSFDQTGFQTFDDEYKMNHAPLLTMASWGWHSFVDPKYTYEDLILTEYKVKGRTFKYPVQKFKNNEKVYDYLRENPHKFNLMKLSLIANNSHPNSKQIKGISQKINLYNGIARSKYELFGSKYKISSYCLHNRDLLIYECKSDAFLDSKFNNLQMDFCYASPDISGSDWSKQGMHTSKIIFSNDNLTIIERVVDDFKYYIYFYSQNAKITHNANHQFTIAPKESNNKFKFSLEFAPNKLSNKYTEQLDFNGLKRNNINYWHKFWQKTGFVDVYTKSSDKRAKELQRRIILSLYLLRINSLGIMPPQETGLLVNSWYGKFHLEMHMWHLAYLALYNNQNELEKNLRWYIEHKEYAKLNAQKNGYKGYRWPKMIGNDCIDSPSVIAPLLVWQQIHIVYMLELIYQKTKSKKLLEKYLDIVQGTLDFVCDFLVYDKQKYNIFPPVMPCQEEFDPLEVYNPTFEIAYFKFGISIGLKWLKRLNKKNALWQKVYKKIATPTIKNNLYLAHEKAHDTYTKYINDHPTQLAIYSFFDNIDVNKSAIKNTLEKVLNVWNEQSMWGWDYGYMSMVASNLNDPKLALDILLKKCPKNYYAKNGHNFQKGRTDLPAYLPGNGALLLAIAVLLNNKDFANNKVAGWQVEYENILKYPFSA
jgi:hypothetical protein